MSLNNPNYREHASIINKFFTIHGSNLSHLGVFFEFSYQKVTKRLTHFWSGKMPKKLDCFTVLLATKWMNVIGHFSPIFVQKIGQKYPRGNFFPKRIHQKKIQLNIPIFSKKKSLRHLVAKQLQKNFDLWST